MNFSNIFSWKEVTNRYKDHRIRDGFCDSDTLPWTLASTLVYSDVAEVYAKFRDEALNESPDVAGDSILFEGSGGFDVYLPLVLRNYP